MKEIDKNLSREELRLEMCRLQDEAMQYRREIERIDNEANKQKYEALLKRCFFRNGYEYFSVEGYDEYFRMYGTTLYDFSEDGVESYSIKLKDSIYEDYLKNAKEITKEEFNQKLRDILDHIKFIE